MVQILQNRNAAAAAATALAAVEIAARNNNATAIYISPIGNYLLSQPTTKINSTIDNNINTNPSQIMSTKNITPLASPHLVDDRSLWVNEGGLCQQNE